MGGTGVRVVRAAIRKQWRDTGGGDVWLRLRVENLDEHLVEQAVHTANRWAEDASAEVLGSFIGPVPGGWSVGIVDAESQDTLTTWVDSLVGALQESGVDAELSAEPSVRLPPFTFGAPPVPTAFMFWSLDWEAMAADPERDAHWFVPRDVSRQLARTAVGFVRPARGTTFLKQGVYTMAADPAVVADAMVSGVEHAVSSGLDVVLDDHTARHVAWCVPGHGVAQVLSDDGWEANLDELTRVLTERSDAALLAFVRAGFRGTLSVEALGNAQPLPGIHEAHVRYRPDLLDRFTPDAHGVQVLTDAHLDRASDLSAWRVSALGAGRHLVEATDPEPWYSTALPDPDVLARAREDFGQMLLNPEAIAANPPPWG